jgi:ATP-dependent DNA helicase RecQ
LKKASQRGAFFFEKKNCIFAKRYFLMDIHAILQKHWGYDSFRPLQEDIIHSVLEGRDTLALLPTGGGKSICFQVPALMKEGICLVITPLIALMKDQVENLQTRGIAAAAIYTGLHFREIELILAHAIKGKIKFLYISPERLKNELLQNSVKQMNVSLLAVDEAHCISQWGYDFRPPYLEIAEFKEFLPENTPILALTATATENVVEDIQARLQFREPNVFKKSYFRDNLTYYVFKEENKQKRLLQIVTRTPGTGIVYVRNRRKTKEIAQLLQNNRISADYYHAGLEMDEREKKQTDWKSGKTSVIVATNAFGMGIDKADVRFVVHLDIPDSLEAYFQEAGRGGRDEKRAYAILLYEPLDILELQRNFDTSFPPPDVISTIYQALCVFLQIPMGNGEGISFDLDTQKFANEYKFSPITVFNSLKFLERAGFFTLSEDLKNTSKVYIPLTREELYRFQIANEQYDDFIKLLLRSYTGLFSAFTAIQEKDLAKRAKVSEENIVLILKKLNNAKVFIYQQKTENSSIHFLQNRIETKHFFLSEEVYEKRKQIAQQRLENTINYVGQSVKCRSRVLLEYFGEKQSARCGKCDICLRRNKLELTDEEFNGLREQILHLLNQQDLTVDALVETLRYPEQKIIQVARWLADNGEICMEGEGLRMDR